MRLSDSSTPPPPPLHSLPPSSLLLTAHSPLIHPVAMSHTNTGFISAAHPGGEAQGNHLERGVSPWWWKADASCWPLPVCNFLLATSCSFPPLDTESFPPNDSMCCRQTLDRLLKGGGAFPSQKQQDAAEWRSDAPSGRSREAARRKNCVDLMAFVETET